MTIIHNKEGIFPHSEFESYSNTSNALINVDDGSGTNTHSWYVCGLIQFSSSNAELRITTHQNANGTGTVFPALSASGTTGYFQNTSGGKLLMGGSPHPAVHAISGHAKSIAGGTYIRGLSFWLWVMPHVFAGSGYGRQQVNGFWLMNGADGIMSGDFWMMGDTVDGGNFKSLKFTASTGSILGSIRSYKWGTY